MRGYATAIASMSCWNCDMVKPHIASGEMHKIAGLTDRAGRQFSNWAV